MRTARLAALACVAVAAGLTAAPVGAAEPVSEPAYEAGRYQVIQGDVIILLDTATGRTWRFAEPRHWYPMTVEPAEDARVRPEGGESAVERWEREAEARRLELMESNGGQAAE